MANPLVDAEIHHSPIELTLGGVPERHIPHLEELYEHYLNAHGRLTEGKYRRFDKPRICIEVPFIVRVTEQASRKVMRNFRE